MFQVNKIRTRQVFESLEWNIFIHESLKQLGPLLLIRYRCILPSFSYVACRVVVLHQNALTEKAVDINYLLRKHAVDLFRRCTYRWPG